jgi:hypothetical protein
LPLIWETPFPFCPPLSADAIKCKRLQVDLDQGQKVSSALVTTSSMTEEPQVREKQSSKAGAEMNKKKLKK